MIRLFSSVLKFNIVRFFFREYGRNASLTKYLVILKLKS